MKFPFAFTRRKDEFQEEIQAHLQMAIADRVARGEPETSARQAAMREFGNVPLVQDVTRRTWGWLRLEYLAQDVRYALRQLHKSPGFTITAVLTLALGIGPNVAIFSLIYAAMLRSLPVPHPEQLVQLKMQYAGQSMEYHYNGLYQGLSHQHALAGLCGWMNGDATDYTAAQPVSLSAADVTGDCFATLGVQPLLGRLITPADDTRQSGPGGFAAVLSYAWWSTRYGRDPNVIGKHLVVRDFESQSHSLVIVGVLPPDFHGMIIGHNPNIYLPSYIQGDQRNGNSIISMLLFGRLKPGVSAARAQAELQPVFQNWLRESQVVESKDPAKAKLTLAPNGTGYSLASEYGKPLELLQCLVAIVLIAACFYLSTMFSARALARRREFAVRAALGAGRTRLIMQSMVESGMLVAAGAIAGIFLAWAASAFLVRFMSSRSDTMFLDVRPGGMVLLFTAAISLLALAITGMLPAWRACRFNALADIAESGSGAIGGGRSRFGTILFPIQVALSLLVVVVSSLLSASLLRVLRQNNGFRLSGSVYVTTDIPMVIPEQDKDGQKLKAAIAMYGDLLDRLNHTPGILSASADVTHPLGGAEYFTEPSSTYRNAPAMPMNLLMTESANPVLENWIEPRWFESAGTRLLQGRDFLQSDNQSSPPVCILSQSAARYYFPGISALGQTLIDQKRKMTVTGVVEDTRFRALESSAPMMVWLPIAQKQTFLPPVEFLLRTEDIGSTVAVLRQLLHDQAGAHVMDVTPVSETVRFSLTRTRLLTTLSNTFAALALLLSAVGIFGLLSYSVSQRVKEIGVRMALGASRTSVANMLLLHAARLIVPGLLLGLGAALAATRLIGSQLYQTKPLDPLAISISVLALVLVSAAGSYLPARRAAHVDPMQALRTE